MLDKLHLAEAMFPDLLKKPETWKSKYIDYSPPITERLYQDIQLEGVNYRLYLHRIHPCERAFFHPHPWPSAIRVLHVPGSTYEMAIGFSSNERHDPPPYAAIIRAEYGFEYEMTHPDGWHYVKISGRSSASVMLTGPVWERQGGAPRTEKYDFRELTDREKENILYTVEQHYEFD